MTRLFLISERRLLAEALTAVLAPDRELTLVGAAPWSAELAGSLADLHADVLLLDTAIDDRRALAAALEIHESGLAVKLVALGLEQPEQALVFIEAGAAAYTLQEDSLEAVRATLENVARGRAACHPALAGLVFARIVELARRADSAEPVAQVAAGSAVEGLSERETEVLELLALGLRNKDIAHRLSIALSTVRNHVQNVLTKLKAHRRRDAIRRACEAGILRDPLPWPSV